MSDWDKFLSHVHNFKGREDDLVTLVERHSGWLSPGMEHGAFIFRVIFQLVWLYSILIVMMRSDDAWRQPAGG